jgi:glutaredoxin-related protein
MLKTKLFLIAGFLIAAFAGMASAQNQDQKSVLFFYSPSCHECMKIKSEIIPKIQADFKDKINIEYRDTGDIENYKYLLSLRDQYGASQDMKVPIIFYEGKFLSGEAAISEDLGSLIRGSFSQAGVKETKEPGFDIVKHFLSFTPLAVVSAGLIDGINPCAFTVIVFFMSFLGFQGYRKKDLTVVGIFFIFSVFLTYLLLGLGFFGFFYSLKGFWLFRRVFNFAIGIFSISLGFLAIYDFIKFKKTGKTEGLALQLPNAVKNKIHRIIGMHYRKTGGPESRGKKASVFILISTALSTGFIVSILEAVCTGQVYLPTITFVLKATKFKLEAFGYLLLYNLMFIAPLFIIFLFSLAGVTSEQFSGFLRRNLLTTKILMAILFLGLGLFLIWRG